VSRAHSRRLGLLAIVVLVVALSAGTGLRIHAQQASPNIQHDEAWSYASAAGRLEPFLAAMDGGFTGRWVPAGEWQRFWTSDGLSGVSDIAPELAAYDVHPPLYFGLLHGWLTITGQHVWAGRALNLVFAALAVLAIFGLALALGFDWLEGALAALVWAVSPAVVSISSLTRQYDLVALTTILLVWGLARATAPRSRRRDGERRSRLRPWLDVLWLAAATCAALLTHYQAVLLVAGAVMYSLAGILLPGRDRRRRPWWPPLLGLAAGTLVAGPLAPGWPGAFGREASRLTDASATAFFEKLDAIAQTLGRFAGVPALAFGVALGAAAVAAIVLFLIPRTRRTLVGRIRKARPGWWTILFFLLVTAGGICLQNLLFLSMPPLISARYLAMAWPFVAFLPLLVFGIWPRLRYALTAAFCLLVLIPATIAAPLLASGADRLPLAQLSQADAVLIDNVGVGELPRFLWSVPAGAPVFAGTQEQLLANREAWSDTALGDKAYYVSILRVGGLRWRRNRILAALQRTHEVTLVGTNGMAEIYTVTPKVMQ
jgi:hypothetical protein